MKNKKSFFKKDISFGRIGLTQKALIAKHLAIMERAGLNISEALEILIESSSGKLKRVMINILKSVESGNSLAESFTRYDNIFSGILDACIIDLT